MKTFAILCLMLVVTSAQITWLLPVSGSFDGTLNWLGGILPSTVATISAVGTYVVSVTKPTTLTTVLNLGGPSSLPTLLVNGATFTVPTLNFVSGTIQVINGSIIVGNQVVVNTTGTAVLNIVSGSLTSATGGIQIAKGQLTITGNAALTDTYDVASGASLLLAGTHNAASCNFLGSGNVILSGRLNTNTPCTTQSNTFVLAGGFIASTNQTAFDLAAVAINGANNTIQGVQVQTTVLTVVAGSLDLVQNASMQVNGTLLSAASAVATIRGNLEVTGNLLVSQGVLALEGTIAAANATVQTQAQLVIQRSQLVAAKIQNAGTVILNQVSTGLNGTANQVIVTGGQVLANASLIIEGGLTQFTDVLAQVNATVKEGATFLVENATLLASQVNNSGRFIINGAVKHTQDFVYNAVNNASIFTNGGSISADQDGDVFHFEGLGNIEGTFQNTTLTVAGRYITSAQVSVMGTLQIIQGTLTTVNGNITATRDVLVTKGSELIVDSLACANTVVIAGDMIIDEASTVLVSGVLSVGGNLQLKEASILNVTRGFVQTTNFTLSNTATYAVQIADSTPEVLNVVNHANLLGGVLQVNSQGFQMTVGQATVVLNYGSHEGIFGNFAIKRGADSLSYGPKSAYVTPAAQEPSSSSTTSAATSTTSSTVTSATGATTATTATSATSAITATGTSASDTATTATSATTGTSATTATTASTVTSTQSKSTHTTAHAEEDNSSYRVQMGVVSLLAFVLLL